MSSAILRRQLARPSLITRTNLTISSRQSVRHNSTILNGLGSCVAVTAESLSSLHHGGLPWYLVLPLVATTLNFTIRLPAQWVTRKIRLQRLQTTPLKQAWFGAYGLNNMLKDRSIATVSPGILRPLREARRINKDFGVSQWKSWASFLGPVVPFVLVSEAVRRLAGSPMTWLGRKLGLDRFLDLVEPGTSTLTDSSLTDGGILWFTDLMAADPYGGLPLICAFSLGWGSWRTLGKERLRELLAVDERGLSNVRIFSNALGRVLLIVPFFPLLFWNLPSAVFLYWAPTFLFNTVNDKLLKKWLPDPKPRYSIVSKTSSKGQPFVAIDGYEIPKKPGRSNMQSRAFSKK